MTAIEAVTFDYWNTLVYEERGVQPGKRVDAWAGVLEDAGFACERDQLHMVFQETWDRFVDAWTTQQQYDAVRRTEEILERLGFDVPPDVQQKLLETFTGPAKRTDLHLTEGVADCLHALKGAGIRLGIICDVGMTPSPVLREHLITHGVLPLFDHWSFSDEVGVYKPDPAIFEDALEGLGGVAPERTAHVGDLRRTDVAGALGMGMTAVRYTGVFDDDSADQPEAHHVVSSHSDIPGALGY